MFARLISIFLVLFGWGLAFAEDNTVTLISGVTSNVPDWIIVGNTGTNNTLIVSAGGLLTTTNFSLIGFWEGAAHNAGTVTGSGSRWISPGPFYIGGFGSYNRLNILAGGVVISSQHVYMAMDTVSTGNTLQVSGAGATLSATNRTLFLGYSGPENSVTVSNQGLVDVSYATLGEGPNSISNQLRVTGSGSMLAARYTVNCGASGSWNRVELANGGRVSDYSGALGSEGSAWHNTVVVDGSVWSNRDRFYVGRRGSFNALWITNGGQMICPGEGHIGERASSTGNLAVVTGTGSRWAVSNVFFVGSEGSSNRLEIRQGGHMDCGWMSYVGDGSLDNSNAHANSVLVTDPNSRWTMPGRWYMGRQSGWNRMELLNGALMQCSNAYIGWGSSPYPSNMVWVDGNGTIWSNKGDLYVSGLGNSLSVSRGARVYAQTARVGEGAVDQMARIVVDGTNSELVVSAWLAAAYYGGLGEVILTNGGRIVSGSGVVGLESYDYGGSVVVTGPGSLWSNAGAVTLGYFGWSNRISIRQGGQIRCRAAEISERDLASDNLAWIEGAGSSWRCDGDLFLGYAERNRLWVENGGLFSCTNAELGYSSVASGNTIRVSGIGSVWSNSGAVQIGTYREAQWNGLEVGTGAQVFAKSMCVGEAASTANYVRLAGAGAVARCRESFCLGLTGSFNRLQIDNGARLISQTGSIGGVAAAISNSAIVTGAGSLWSNAGPLVVGGAGRDNRLWLREGARVEAVSLVVGSGVSAGGQVVCVESNSVLAVAGAAEWRRGALHLDQGVVSCAVLMIQTNARLSGMGSVLAAQTENYGWIEVGAPVGRLSLNGAFSQKAGATLSLDLGGTNAESGYDQISIVGSIGLGGTLTISRVAGFLPRSNDTFCVLAYTSTASGAFSGTNLPAWFSWQVASSSSGLLLRVTGVQCATQDVPKAWLSDYGWTNNFDTASLGDQDGDRVPTWQEYQAGTNPTNAASVFECLPLTRISNPMVGTVMHWQPVTGRLYAIEVSTNLLAPTWFVLTNELPATLNSWTDTVTQTDRRQYRIRVKSP